MAAAIIPLVAAIAPEIISLITGLVHKAAPAAEAAHGASTGPVKFADVFASVITSLTKAAEAGSIPKALPSDDAVKTVIQSVVSSLKQLGLLDAAAVVAPATATATQTVTLRAGQSVTISVAP